MSSEPQGQSSNKYITLSHLQTTAAALLEKIYDVQEEAEEAIESASSSVNADSPVFQNQITIGSTILTENSLMSLLDTLEQITPAAGVYF